MDPIAHDSTLYNIHYKSNKQKALESLLGILYGISADKTLNTLEILFLDTWIKENNFLTRDPDAIDILDCTNEILTNQTISSDAIEDLFNLIGHVLEYRKIDQSRDQERANTNILLGIIQGIMADSVILDDEVLSLNKWLKHHPIESWPAPIIRQKLKEILADGVITSEEKSEIKELLSTLGANKLTTTGSTSSLTVTLGTTTPENISFENKIFCFTGKFLCGNRNHCENLIIERGAKAASNVNQKTNYLVLGEFPSRDWITSSYGLKIQSALELKNQGVSIELLTEETWYKFITINN